MRCATSSIEISLLEDGVQIILRCDTPYEAAILYDDITEAGNSGGLILNLDGMKKRDEVPR